MRETKVVTLGVPMRRTFLLCELSEDENGEIGLRRLEEIDKDEETAGRRAVELCNGDPDKRIVQMTSWQIQTSSW